MRLLLCIIYKLTGRQAVLAQPVKMFCACSFSWWETRKMEVIRWARARPLIQNTLVLPHQHLLLPVLNPGQQQLPWPHPHIVWAFWATTVHWMGVVTILGKMLIFFFWEVKCSVNPAPLFPWSRPGRMSKSECKRCVGVVGGPLILQELHPFLWINVEPFFSACLNTAEGV